MPLQLTINAAVGSMSRHLASPVFHNGLRAGSALGKQPWPSPAGQELAAADPLADSKQCWDCKSEIPSPEQRSSGVRM